MGYYRAHVLVCAGAGCISAGCKAVHAALLEELKRQGLENEIRVVETGCVGSCDLGPVIIIYPEGVFYRQVKAGDVPELVAEHLLKGRVVERLLYREPESKELVRTYQDMVFFNRQERIALRNVGIIDPESIDEYIGREGYEALAKVLTSMTPEQVIDAVKRSGMRGRGGAGFSTGMKWEFASKAKGDIKYVLCNADEGDPGAFMDRSILEGDPHSIIEAMAICGYAIGAHQGYVYVRAEYPLAVERLGIAIRQAREYGLLGKNLFNTGFDFDLDIRVGAGAFVCGEETALIASIEGKRGEPRPRPPFPANAGLWGKPTNNNNVETYANIPVIFLKGPEYFASIGTEKSKGTKVFALAGNINNTGLVEVPMGMTLREIIFDLGGGIPGGRKFKAAQTGGPSGGCLTEAHLDLAMDYDSLTQAGAFMGSGGLIVMDDRSCMVDVARYFLDFTCDESCGKCPPCRIGTKRMKEILERIVSGKGEEGDIEKLEQLASMIKQTSLCGLGQGAPNPVLTTLKYFRHEYEAHIREKRCPAGACKPLLRYEVIAEMCKGCGLCARNCPSKSISGELKKPYQIDTDKCSRCGICMEKCPFKAIRRG